MEPLIEQLQRRALDPRTNVSDILRMAKAIAVKLDLPEFEAWVEKELNGYPNASVPGYRIIRGPLGGSKSFRGWPVKEYLVHKVAELEVLAANAGGREVAIPLKWPIRQFLSDGDLRVTVEACTIAGIVDTVRNALLEWALKLEKSGVRGEGMSFTDDERERARQASTVYNINTLVGSLGPNSGSVNVQGNIVNPDLKAVEGLVEKIRATEAQLGLGPSCAKELRDALDSLQGEVRRPAPSTSKIRELLLSIRKIAEGAAGSLLAQGILHEIAKLIL